MKRISRDGAAMIRENAERGDDEERTDGMEKLKRNICLFSAGREGDEQNA